MSASRAGENGHVWHIPMLFRGGLSGRVFVATKWHHEDGHMVADEKFDITDQFVAVALEFDEDWWNAKTEEAQRG